MGTTTGTIHAVTTSSNVANVLGGIGAESSANSAPSWVTENIYGLVLDSSPVQVGGLATVRGGSAGDAGGTGGTAPGYTNAENWSGKAGTAGSVGNYSPNANTEGASGGKGYTGNSGTATGVTAGVGGAGGAGGISRRKGLAGSGRPVQPPRARGGLTSPPIPRPCGPCGGRARARSPRQCP